MHINEPCRKIKLIDPGKSRRRDQPCFIWINGMEKNARKQGCRNWRGMAEDRDA